MARWLGLDRIYNFMLSIKQNGGILSSIYRVYRVDLLKSGTLVGEDKYGNQYYENNSYAIGKNRWVIYSPMVNLDYDAAQVPAEWFGWLHYKTDLLPHQDPGRPKHKWMADHTPNLTGTERSYVPYSTTKTKIEAWQPKD